MRDLIRSSSASHYPHAHALVVVMYRRLINVAAGGRDMAGSFVIVCLNVCVRTFGVDSHANAIVKSLPVVGTSGVSELRNA